MPDNRSIQAQIIDALESTMSVTTMQRGDEATLVPNGNIEIDQQFGSVKKTLSVTLEVRLTVAGDVYSADYEEQLDEAYGDYLIALFGADLTLGGLADEVSEAAPSPIMFEREPGSDIASMQLNFNITYCHDIGNPRTQLNSS